LANTIPKEKKERKYEGEKKSIHREIFYTRHSTSCGSMSGVKGDVNWLFFTVRRRYTRRLVGAGTSYMLVRELNMLAMFFNLIYLKIHISLTPYNINKKKTITKGLINSLTQAILFFAFKGSSIITLCKQKLKNQKYPNPNN